MNRSIIGRERGITLVLALLFLVVITLITIAGFNAGTTNTRVTSNMMVRQETVAAAHSAIEQVISNTNFTVDPAAVAAADYPVDIDGDGDTDYTAELNPAPECYRVRPIRMTELNPEDAQDVACMISGAVSNSGLESTGAPAGVLGASLCANSDWNIRSTVTDGRTGTQTNVNQGVGVRVPITDASNACK